MKFLASTRLLAVIISAALLGLAHAASLDFKGHKIGDDIQSVKKTFNIGYPECNGHRIDGIDHIVCTASTSEYAVPLSGLTFWFTNDKLSWVHAEFDSSDFLSFRDAAIEKMGKPSELSQSTVTNSYGASLPAATLQWRSEGIEFVIRQRAQSILSGRLSMKAIADPKQAIETVKKNAKKM